MMADALLLVAAISACVVYLVMVVLARRRERELADARAHEQRLKSLTELSADWFWETDAGHRITWLSGGGPVATLFGDTPTYGKRFWELPRVEVEARALEAHLERLGKQLPFFDLEIDDLGCRGSVDHERHLAELLGQIVVALDDEPRHQRPGERIGAILAAIGLDTLREHHVAVYGDVLEIH